MTFKPGDYVRSRNGMEIRIRDEVHAAAVNRQVKHFEPSSKEEYERYWEGEK